MNNKYLKIIIITLISSFFIDTYAQSESYGYENWSGKNGNVKSNIELTNQLISKYNLSFTKGSTGNSFFYKIPVNENDNTKKGRLQVEVFSSIEKAQLALVDYLESLSTPYKPPLLTYEDLKVGDVAFGREYNGIFRISFTKNNVIIIVHAPTDVAKAIALEVDKTIKNAPVWEKDTPIPSFILPE